MSIRSTRRLVPFAALLALALPGPSAAAGQDAEPGADDPAAPPAETAPIASPAAPGRHDSTGHGWEEAWRLGVSRGIGTPMAWVDSLLLVASLDRNVHLIAPGETAARVVWDANFRGGFEATPLVTATRIYLPETRRGRRLVALDRHDRRVLWTADAGDLAAEPIGRGETVFTVSSTGEAMAWGPNGTRRWKTELETRVVAAPILLGDALVVAASDGTLHALDPATGAVRKTLDAEAGMIWGDPVLAPDGTDVALFATLDGQLLSVGGDLAVSARRSFPSRFYTGPAVDGGRVFLIGHEGTAWAYGWQADEVLWKAELAGAFRAGPSLGERFVALGDLAGTLYLLDRSSGALLWHARLDGAITAAPTAVGNSLLVGTERGSLYRFRPTS